jgi:hypothetical protein
MIGMHCLAMHIWLGVHGAKGHLACMQLQPALQVWRFASPWPAAGSGHGEG